MRQPDIRRVRRKQPLWVESGHVASNILLIIQTHSRRAMKPIVAYVRVSTSQQGRSGLGIDAQREALAHFAKEAGYDISAEFVEVETGKGSDALDRRPQLAAALAKARSARCPVAVAKLDRLSRDVHFISDLLIPGLRVEGSDRRNSGSRQL